MDVRSLKFDSDSFDVAIDKGTFNHCLFEHLFGTPDRHNGRDDDGERRCLGARNL